MFKVEPHYSFDTKDVALPTCMFKMDKLVGKEAVTIPRQCGTEVTMDIQLLEKRQERILKELEDIRQEVESLEQKLGVQSSSLPPSTKQVTSGTAAVLGNIIHDVVVYANPDSPPYSLVYLHKRLQEHCTCRTAVHVHSSVRSVPEKLLNCFGNGSQVERPDAKISITLIWKDVKHGPEMRVNPSHQTPICGEANIARYLARLLQPSYEVDLLSACLADHWLDLASFSLIGGNSKERAAAVRSLNSHLGRKPWLLEETSSFVDAVVFSALQQTGQASSASGNVKTWLKGCESDHLFQQMRTLIA